MPRQEKRRQREGRRGRPRHSYPASPYEYCCQWRSDMAPQFFPYQYSPIEWNIRNYHFFPYQPPSVFAQQPPIVTSEIRRQERGRDSDTDSTSSSSSEETWSPEEVQGLETCLSKYSESILTGQERTLQVGQINWNEVSKHIDNRSARECREMFETLYPGKVFVKSETGDVSCQPQESIDVVNNSSSVTSAGSDRKRKREPWTPEELRTIQELYNEHGTKWTRIAQLMGGKRRPKEIRHFYLKQYLLKHTEKEEA